MKQLQKDNHQLELNIYIFKPVAMIF